MRARSLVPAALLLLASGCDEAGRGSDSSIKDVPGPTDGSRLEQPAGGERIGGVDHRGGEQGSGQRDGGGPAPPPGTLLFEERFEDGRFSDRGWYDGAPAPTLSTTTFKEGKSALECRYLAGKQGCAGGSPARHTFAATETAYLSYWVKYSANFVGSQKAYHPHELHFLTDIDDRWIGPSRTHLTAYIEQVGGIPRLALQDALNVDPKCVLLNNGSTAGGCNGGSFSSYPFTESRSVCSCNGIVGDLDLKDCYNDGVGWYSARAWTSKTLGFKDQAGPEYKADWHRVEAYFKMNSIVGGKGVPDGVLRYWFDGKLIIDHSKILLRTGQHPTLKFNQLFIGMYIGDGSPVEQTMWVDHLIVGTGKP